MKNLKLLERIKREKAVYVDIVDCIQIEYFEFQKKD
jgi:hypothetical protein